MSKFEDGDIIVGYPKEFAVLRKKAKLFDYLSWLEDLYIKEIHPGDDHVCISSDQKVFSGKTYIQAVQKAAIHDKKI